MHRGADHAGQPIEVLPELGRMDAVEDGRDRRVGVDRHFEALGPEAPVGIEMAVAHEPVHGDADDDLVANQRLPVELASPDLTRLDDAQR